MDSVFTQDQIVSVRKYFDLPANTPIKIQNIINGIPADTFYGKIVNFASAADQSGQVREFQITITSKDSQGDFTLKSKVVPGNINISERVLTNSFAVDDQGTQKQKSFEVISQEELDRQPLANKKTETTDPSDLSLSPVTLGNPVLETESIVFKDGKIAISNQNYSLGVKVTPSTLEEVESYTNELKQAIETSAKDMGDVLVSDLEATGFVSTSGSLKSGKKFSFDISM